MQIKMFAGSNHAVVSFQPFLFLLFPLLGNTLAKSCIETSELFGLEIPHMLKVVIAGSLFYFLVVSRYYRKLP